MIQARDADGRKRGEARVRGARFAWDRRGQGPARVWSHGHTLSRAIEDRMGLFPFDAWAEGCTLLRYDLRGHGESEAEAFDADYTGWQGLAADILGLMDAWGVARATLGGMSLGAAASLEAAVVAPERVEALLLAFPPPAWDLRAARVSHYTRAVRMVERLGAERVARATLAAPPPPFFAQSEAAWRCQSDGLLETPQSTLVRVLTEAIHSDHSSKEALAAVRAPTRVLATPHWPGHPVEVAEALVEALPGAELVVVDDFEAARDVLAGWR